MKITNADLPLPKRYAQVESIRSRHHGSSPDGVYYSLITTEDIAFLFSEIDRLREIVLKLACDPAVRVSRVRLAGMPTAQPTTPRASTDAPHTARHEARPVESELLAHELEQSDSAVIYVDIPGMDDKQAQAMLLGDPALHVEHDAVRDKWAVRTATTEEVAQAKAEHEAASASSAQSTAGSSTD